MSMLKRQNSLRRLSLALLLGAAIGLTGCAENQFLNDLTGEPKSGVSADRAGVPRVDAREKIWPNLADVPARPAAPPPLTQREAEQSELLRARSQGLDLLQQREVR
jgi:hypothetical protein